MNIKMILVVRTRGQPYGFYSFTVTLFHVISAM